MIEKILKKLPIALILVICFSLYGKYGFSETLPTNTVGRVSYVEGEVVVKAEDIEEEVKVTINMPVLPGDLIRTEGTGKVEIEMADGTKIRASSGTSFIMKSPADERSLPNIQFNSGRLGIKSTGSLSLMLSGRNFVIVSNVPALFHVRDDGGIAEMSVRVGEISIEGNWGRKPVSGGMTALIKDNSIRTVHGIVHAGWVIEFSDKEIKPADYMNSPNKFGYYELESYGRWIYTPVYGYIWRPHTHWGWAPYTNGYWVWRKSAGWIWISFEPWGWLPYHYGRWVYMPAWGWCWVPGSHWAFWIPGVVYWIYGPGWIAWVPLAPGEVLITNGIAIIRPINYGYPGGIVIVDKSAIIKNRIVVRPIKLIDDPLRKGRIVKSPPPMFKDHGNAESVRIHTHKEINEKPGIKTERTSIKRHEFKERPSMNNDSIKIHRQEELREKHREKAESINIQRRQEFREKPEKGLEVNPQGSGESKMIRQRVPAYRGRLSGIPLNSISGNDDHKKRMEFNAKSNEIRVMKQPKILTGRSEKGWEFYDHNVTHSIKEIQKFNTGFRGSKWR